MTIVAAFDGQCRVEAARFGHGIQYQQRGDMLFFGPRSRSLLQLARNDDGSIGRLPGDVDAVRPAFGPGGNQAGGGADAAERVRVGIGKFAGPLERGHRHRAGRAFVQ